MMPEAARERTVSFRARAPHSLRIREYPRPKASVDERDSLLISELVTIVKSNISVSVTGREDYVIAGKGLGVFGKRVRANKRRLSRRRRTRWRGVLAPTPQADCAYFEPQDHLTHVKAA